MKTLVKSLALALSLGFVTTAATFAETNPGGRPAVVASYKTGIYTSVDGRLVISLDKQTGGAVDVRLKNSEGSTVYSQRIGKNETQYRAKLDVSALPDGSYEVEITNGAETTKHMVTLSTPQRTTPVRTIAMN
jgi:hypothetical protein